LPQSDDPHVGSLDIDVALDFSKIPDDSYQTILKAFLNLRIHRTNNSPSGFLEQ